VSSISEKKNELNLEECKRVIDRLNEINTLSIQFTGGEPFIRKDFLRILKYASQYNFSLTVLTNATLIDKKIAKKLGKLNLTSVQVSLDGSNASTHEKIRGVKGCFNKTLFGIKNLVNEGVRVTIATTFSKYNIKEMRKIYSLVEQLGVSAFLFGFVFPVGRGKNYFNRLSLSTTQMRKVQNFLLEKGRRGKVPVYIDENVSILEKGKGRPPICKAGRTMLAISAEGNFILCPMLPSVILGNIRGDDILSVWKKSKILAYIRNIKNVKGPCKECPILEKCGGGCKAMSFYTTGNLMGSDPFCPRKLYKLI
jgi:radical SAM protein with 4Fe4S-binding SPASM domain